MAKAAPRGEDIMTERELIESLAAIRGELSTLHNKLDNLSVASSVAQESLALATRNQLEIGHLKQKLHVVYWILGVLFASVVASIVAYFLT